MGYEAEAMVAAWPEGLQLITVLWLAKAEQQEKEKRQKEKEEAHLYVVIKVACDTDFKTQIGNVHHFDLVNFDQVKSYRIHKRTKFEDFRKKVLKDVEFLFSF